MTESTFSLSACKKSGYFICSVLRYSQFYSPKTRLVTPIFDHAHPINFWSAFKCYESASTCKKISLLHLFILQMESILASHHMPGHIHLLTTPTPKIFNVFSTCMNLYQNAKKQLNLEIQWTLESRYQICSIYYAN